MNVDEARRRLLLRTSIDEDGCWRWQGCRTTIGYGQISFQGTMWTVHRLAYEAWTGPIPDGRVLDHLCRVRHCLNPAHLEAVTYSENNRRSIPYRVPRGLCRSCRERLTELDTAEAS